MAGGEEMSTSLHVQSPLMRTRPAAAQVSLGWRLLAFLIGAVFLYAGVLKAWAPLAFASDISHYHILPWPVGIRLAFYLPWLEILCALALIFGWLRTGAVGVLSALTVIFIGASIIARARGIDVSCGCFGATGKGLTFTWHLVIDLAILAGLLALYFSPLAVRARGGE